MATSGSAARAASRVGFRKERKEEKKKARKLKVPRKWNLYTLRNFYKKKLARRRRFGLRERAAVTLDVRAHGVCSDWATDVTGREFCF